MHPGSPDPELRQRFRAGLWSGLLLALMLYAVSSCRHPLPIPQSDARESLSNARGSHVVPSPVAKPVTEPSPVPVVPAQPGSDTAPAITADATSGRPREIPEGAWSDLVVPEFEPARVWYRRHAPLLVVTHGAGGEAEWHCQRFQRMFGGRISLLCPRGKRRVGRDPSQGYYYPDHLALHREVHAAIDRFEARAPEARASRPHAYAGYSQGATMGALAFAKEGTLFSRLLLVEGGYADWSNFLATRFQRSGGQAVLIVCGTKACDNHARAAAFHLSHAKLRVRTAWAKGAGHRPDGPVEEATVKNLPFLLEGDPRWAEFLPPTSE